jgi:hypothetical protein
MKFFFYVAPPPSPSARKPRAPGTPAGSAPACGSMELDFTPAYPALSPQRLRRFGHVPGLLSIAPIGAGSPRVRPPRNSRLHFRERHGATEEAKPTNGPTRKSEVQRTKPMENRMGCSFSVPPSLRGGFHSFTCPGIWPRAFPEMPWCLPASTPARQNRAVWGPRKLLLALESGRAFLQECRSAFLLVFGGAAHAK